MTYKSACFLFFDPWTNMFFFGYEPHKKEWRTFGGKVEKQDNGLPIKTAVREFNEESGSQFKLPFGTMSSFVFYVPDSKMVVYFVVCSRELVYNLSRLKPSQEKSSYAWLTGSDRNLPFFIRQACTIARDIAIDPNMIYSIL
jgi:hypothetical protein